MDLLKELHAVNPYTGFPVLDYHLVLNDWESSAPLIPELVNEVRPNLVVEVGCWLGGASVVLAKTMPPGAKLLCVDTWLGSREFWDNQHDGTRYGTLALKHGYPTVYYQFLANVILTHCEDRVVPFPTTSTIAALWLAAREIRPDLVYIDASHDYEDAALDMRSWWKVLRPGGVLFGDDVANPNFPGVALAFHEFSPPDSRGRKEMHGNKWLIRKAPRG